MGIKNPWPFLIGLAAIAVGSVLYSVVKSWGWV